MKWKFWQPDYDLLDGPPGTVEAHTLHIPNPPDEALPAFLAVTGLEIGSDVRSIEGDLKADPSKEKTFDDEVDPAWKDSDTAE